MATLSRVLGTLAVTTGLAFAVTVNAQTTTAPSTAPTTKSPGGSSASTIPDKKLDAVAAAAKKVVVINRSYKAKVDQASDAQKKQQLTNEANQAMTKAVTDEGLSVNEYMSIMQVARADPAVRDKLMQRMK